MIINKVVIYFFNEDVRFPLQGRKNEVKKFLKSLVKEEGKRVGEINYIFCSDEYLLNINKEYLNHHYYTDVITFDTSESTLLNGDIYISLDTVAKNAEIYETKFENELFRVVFHGLLHLCGYKDKTEDEEKQMRSKEDYYLEQNLLQ